VTRVAENGGALTEARQQVHRLRGSLRRADAALAELSKLVPVGSIVVDGDAVDDEVLRSVCALLDTAAAQHPGQRLEVVINVMAPEGADRRQQ
jgi:hypothetical protein